MLGEGVVEGMLGLMRVGNALQGLRDDGELYLESDTDEQLLIHLTFQQGECRWMEGGTHAHTLSKTNKWAHSLPGGMCCGGMALKGLNMVAGDDGACSG